MKFRIKKSWRIYTIPVIAILIVASLIPRFFRAYDAFAVGSCSIAVFSDFAACWISQSGETDIDITVTADVTMTGIVTIPAGKNVTITSDVGQRVLTRGPAFVGNMFNVNNTTANSLTLTSIILDGNGDGTPNVTGSLINLGNAADTVTVGPGTILRNNFKTSASGGAIMVSGGVLNVNSATITGNTTASTGGGIYATTAGAQVNLTSAIITNNTANTGNGGGVILTTTASSLSIAGTTLVDGNISGAQGGGIKTSGSATVDISGTLTISNNISETGGGGMNLGGPSAISLAGTIVIDSNSTNATSGNGGGVYFGNNTVVDANSLSSLQVTNNTANIANGGGLYLAGTSFDFPSDTLISGNQALGPCNRYAGGMYITGTSTIALSGSTQIVNNYSECYAGGIYIQNASTLSISDSVAINNNIADGNGGGILTDSSTVVLSISDNVTISNNQSGSSGGGLRLAGADSVTIAGNVQINNNTAVTAGGGISTFKGVINTFNISDSVQIINNSTDGSGGAINVNPYGGGTQILNIGDNVVISGNSAALDGGAIALRGDDVTDSVVNISGGVQITDNTCGVNGGGVSVEYERLANVNVADGVVFSNNSAGSYTTLIAPIDQPTYDAHIFGTVWTSPFTFGYNNYDISYTSHYTVSFNTNSAGPLADEIVFRGDIVDEPTISRAGYAFLGWFTLETICSPECIDNYTLFDFNTPIMGDMQLYALWEKLPDVSETGSPTIEDDSMASQSLVLLSILAFLLIACSAGIYKTRAYHRHKKTS